MQENMNLDNVNGGLDYVTRVIKPNGEPTYYYVDQKTGQAVEGSGGYNSMAAAAKASESYHEGMYGAKPKKVRKVYNPNLNNVAGGVVMREVTHREKDGTTYGPYFVIDNDTGKPVTDPDGKRISFSDEVIADIFNTGYHKGKEALKNQFGMIGNGR